MYQGTFFSQFDIDLEFKLYDWANTLTTNEPERDSFFHFIQNGRTVFQLLRKKNHDVLFSHENDNERTIGSIGSDNILHIRFRQFFTENQLIFQVILDSLVKRQFVIDLPYNFIYTNVRIQVGPQRVQPSSMFDNTDYTPYISNRVIEHTRIETCDEVGIISLLID